MTTLDAATLNTLLQEVAMQLVQQQKPLNLLRHQAQQEAVVLTGQNYCQSRATLTTRTWGKRFVTSKPGLWQMTHAMRLGI